MLWGAARFDGYTFAYSEHTVKKKNTLALNFFSRRLRGMKQLHAYLKTHKANALAEAIGISPSYLSDIKKGNRVPSLRVAFAIEDATSGAVPARSWLTQ